MSSSELTVHFQDALEPGQFKAVSQKTVDAETLIHSPDSWTGRLDLDSMFPVQRPLQVELGSGDGGFMLACAQRNPATNYIAVERLLGRLRKLDRKGRRAGIENLRLVRIEASYFIEWLLPPACVCAVHIYFPDPWPKRRHHKNRLIDDEFTSSLERVLVPGGRVFLRTDNVDYFQRMIRSFEYQPHFIPVDTPAALKEFKTDFETWFNDRGTPTNYAAYQRKGMQ